jgi:hypothetical protein
MHALAVLVLARAALSACPVDRPPTWPRQFVLVQRKIPDAGSASGNATTVTYYDWDAGANLIVITPDADESDVLVDLELTSGHSYRGASGMLVGQPGPSQEEWRSDV